MLGYLSKESLKLILQRMKENYNFMYHVFFVNSNFSQLNANWFKLVAGSLESANWSILAARRLFKEVVGKKSGFYVN